MSGHSEASSQSWSLCDQLFAALGHRIPDLQRSESKRWCGFYRRGHSRFAYISHFKSRSRIQVWPRGQAPDWARERGVSYNQRHSIESGWATNFQGRFDVGHAAEIAVASDALYRLSYPET